MIDDLRPPYRIAFDNARDPYTARNALGIPTVDLSGYAPVGAEYITSTADATLTAERVLTDTATVTWDRATAGQIKANVVAAATDPTPPQGRLTLLTLTPVMTSTQSAKTTIYYTPYVGNKVPIYDGTNTVMTTFTELSVATTDTTKSPAAIGASKVNDWFVWSDAGTIRIGHGPDWTSDTARSAGTALVMVNGILLNNASITNGPAAQRGTYVGTTRSASDAALYWLLGGPAAGGSPSFLGVWNCYNRVNVWTEEYDTTSSWTYATATWRSLNGSTNHRHQIVIGLPEEPVDLDLIVGVAASAGVNGLIGIGQNITTAPSSQFSFGGNASGVSIGVKDTFNLTGFHFFQAIEYASAATVTFFGANAAVSRMTFSMHARM